MIKLIFIFAASILTCGLASGQADIESRLRDIAKQNDEIKEGEADTTADLTGELVRHSTEIISSVTAARDAAGLNHSHLLSLVSNMTRILQVLQATAAPSAAPFSPEVVALWERLARAAVPLEVGCFLNFQWTKCGWSIRTGEGGWNISWTCVLDSQKVHQAFGRDPIVIDSVGAGAFRSKSIRAGGVLHHLRYTWDDLYGVAVPMCRVSPSAPLAGPGVDVGDVWAMATVSGNCSGGPPCEWASCGTLDSDAHYGDAQLLNFQGLRRQRLSNPVLNPVLGPDGSPALFPLREDSGYGYSLPSAAYCESGARPGFTHGMQAFGSTYSAKCGPTGNYGMTYVADYVNTTRYAFFTDDATINATIINHYRACDTITSNVGWDRNVTYLGRVYRCIRPTGGSFGPIWGNPRTAFTPATCTSSGDYLCWGLVFMNDGVSVFAWQPPFVLRMLDTFADLCSFGLRANTADTTMTYLRQDYARLVGAQVYFGALESDGRVYLLPIPFANSHDPGGVAPTGSFVSWGPYDEIVLPDGSTLIDRTEPRLARQRPLDGSGPVANGTCSSLVVNVTLRLSLFYPPGQGLGYLTTSSGAP